MARNKGAAERRRERSVEVFMTQPEARQNGRHNGDQGQQDRHEEHAEEEDFEGLMETVAEAVRAAKRDAEASRAARDREGATAAEMRDEDRPRGMEAAEDSICLQETIATALGSPANAIEQRRQQMGKAPAETVGTSTPPVERR
jgi:DNA-binding protein YbaB